MHDTESQIGHAPKPPFQIKPNETYEESGDQGQINHQTWSPLSTILMKQHFAYKQDPDLEVCFGATTMLTPISRSGGKLPV